MNVSSGTKPRVYYKKSGDNNTFVGNTSADNGWKYVEANGTSTPFDFTIDYSIINGGSIGVGDVVQYFVVAQDNAPAQNVAINSGTFAAQPTSVALTSAAFPIGGTINSYTIQASISGTFHVGTAQSAPYNTLTAAIAEVNSKVMNGAVTLLLDDATYNSTSETFPITIAQNSGASATNILTIKPNTSNTATITGSASALLKLNGADYVIIDGSNSGGSTRDLTINNTNTASCTPVWIASLGTGQGATNVTLKNCTLSTGSTTATTTYGVFTGASSAVGTAGDDNDQLLIQNNAINTAYYGVYAAAGSTGLLDGLQILQNAIGSSVTANQIGKAGITVIQATGATIAQNEIFNINGAVTNPQGIVIGTGVVSSSVSRNSIHGLFYNGTGGYGGKGIDINTGTASSALTISNNILYDILGDGWSTLSSDAIVGIRILGSTGGVNLYYNTVNLSGNAPRTAATVSAALYIVSTASSLNIRDNILSNSIVNATTSSKAYAIYSDAASSAFTAINYNDYYQRHPGSARYIGAADKATLSARQPGTTQDANSISADPLVNSATSLKPQLGSPVLATGTPVSVTVDYDNNSRSGSTPSMGAYENGADVVGPVVTYTALSNALVATSRTFSNVAATDISGINGSSGTRPRVYYKKGNLFNEWNDNTSSTQGWKWVEAMARHRHSTSRSTIRSCHW
ncbi:MAG: hypothetical protein IPP94_17510 [Ignavibacteria bacterium]|nr:hypothetical protein [Ignavibacteria bacterium]